MADRSNNLGKWLHPKKDKKQATAKKPTVVAVARKELGEGKPKPKPRAVKAKVAETKIIMAKTGTKKTGDIHAEQGVKKRK